MYILHVIPFQRSTHKEELSYFSLQDVALGACVEMPYGKRSLMGVVTSCIPLADMKSQVKNMSFQLKNIHRVLKSAPLHPAMLGAVEKYHNQSLVSRNSILDRILPVGFLAVAKEFLNEDESSSSEHPFVATGYHTTLLQQSTEDRIDTYVGRVREALSGKHSAVVVCPSISMVKSVADKLSKGIADHVLVFHSHLTKKKLQAQYERVLSADESVVCIMTPYFLGVTPKNTQLCIVHDAGSAQYLSVTRPYIDFRILIELFSQSAGIECMMSDTLLPLTIALRADQDPLVTWYAHASYRSKKGITQENIEHKFSDAILNPEVVKKIQKKIKDQKNIGIYVPRTGYASITKCNDCQHVMACTTCDAPLRLHRSVTTNFACHRCKTKIPVTDHCQKCNGMRLVMLGITVGKIMEAVASHIPQDQIIAITGETIGKKKTYTALKSLEKENKGIVCVGTGPLMHVPYLFDTTIMASAAHIFAHTEYNSYEQSLRTLMQLQEKTEHTLLIQSPEQYTSLVDVYITMPIAEQLTYEKSLREEYQLPPYTQRAHIIVSSDARESMSRFLGVSQITLKSYSPKIMTRMPYSGYRGGMCVEISYGDNAPLSKIVELLEGFKGEVYVLVQ